jgi:hypothetical protein
LGQDNATLRREIFAVAQSCSDFQHRRKFSSRIPRAAALPAGGLAQEPGPLLLHGGQAKSTSRSTNYHARPEDSLAKSVMIWLDKQAIALYSRAKARFGFSDDVASKILERLFGKK